MSFKGFFSIFSFGSSFVQQSGTILAILVEGHPRISPCHHDASNQVSAKTDLRFRRCGLKNFKMAAILGHWNGTLLAILTLHNTPMPPIQFQLNPTFSSGADMD